VSSIQAVASSLLAKLLADEIQAHQRHNLAQAKTFKALLEQTLQRYHNRLIDAAAVIDAMLAIRKDMERADQRAAKLGLEADELAFYDAVAAQGEAIYGVDFLRDLVHDVVQTIKRTVKVDWTKPHRDDVKAAVRAAVRRVLRTRDVKVEDLEPLMTAVMVQADALYSDWPQVA
jgi:type I restriction enzyme R subunit